MTTATRLGLVEFARSLVQTGDLDPIYLMLLHADMPLTTLYQWCIAYWLFYHAGVASTLATTEPNLFWERVAAFVPPGAKTPRGTERRHFRGKNAELAITKLAAQYPMPMQMIGQLPAPERVGDVIPLPSMMASVQAWPQFGPWIAFKVSDMADAVLDIPVQFEGYEDRWFDAPQRGAWIHVVGGTDDEWLDEPKGNRVVAAREGAAYLRGQLADLRCPHAERPLGTQEFETIFCKWKSHLNGHYPLGKDTHEILEALKGWGPLADLLRNSLTYAQAELP